MIIGIAANAGRSTGLTSLTSYSVAAKKLDKMVVEYKKYLATV